MACFCIASAHAAYLRNIPMTVNQPDGTVLHCFASGDEFFNYLHDSDGYTIIQHPQTGYYVYAAKRDGKLVATDYVAGVYNPASKGLEPYALISPEEWMARRQAWEVPDVRPKNRDNINHGTLNNISIFIRFSDDEELTNSFYSINNMFNDVSENAISMRSYFRAASYGAIEVPTTFYPGHDGETIISYQDSYPRSYFEPYNASTNTNGYTDDERATREFALLERAVNYINANYPVPTSLNIDYDNDGLVDNVCFIVKGGVGDWNSLLWPHKWALQDRTVNFQLADASGYFNASVMCHEMNHSLGAPDLYHYYNGTNLSPVGSWDLMENNATPPQHCGAYMKMKYGHWIDEIPEITQAGVYTLNPISSPTPTNVAYKIQSDDPNQFYIVEYRDKSSLFETALPGSGLLVYRIDTRFGGNAGYDPSNGIYDEVYLFRPGGSTTANGTLSTAHFSSNVGRTEFSSSTSAYPFYTDGTIDNNFRIYDITSAGSTISFTYGTSSECEPPTNLFASVNNTNVTLTWDAAANAVSYNIYRGGSLIGNTSETTYLDAGLSYGIYNYFLKSVDANELLSTVSETITVTITPEGGVIVGDGNSATNDYLPSYSYYNYSLTQQIYTSEELGDEGVITGIAFYNGGTEKTRNYDIYMKSTTKNNFTSATDWVAVSDADKVFSGSVIMKANVWTYINLSTFFNYDGNSNVVLVVDDNTGSWSSGMSCRVFNASNKALYAYDDDINFNPLSPPTSSASHNGVLSVKNQLIVSKMTPSTDFLNIIVSADPVQGGTTSGGGEFSFGSTCTVVATPNEGYYFAGWTENKQLVSTDMEFSFVVVQDRNLVANFEEGVLIGDNGDATNPYLPSYSFYKYSLTQQIYTAEEIGSACIINSIAFYNGGAEKTRTYDFYMKTTTKSTFTGATDWIAVTSNDKVFSGSVTMVANDWTTIVFDTPFVFDGTSNVVLVVDDNSGAYTNSPHMSCRVFDAPSQALYAYNDNTNFNPLSPPTSSSSYNAVLSSKNQIRLDVIPMQTFTKVINGYGTNDGGYYLIASPIDGVNPAEIDGMILTGDGVQNYDFYWFDQTEEDEWRTYKAGDGFNLVPGKGYLYANKDGVTLSVTGVPNTDGEVSLVKDDNAEFPGMNLVGNPFGVEAYIEGNRPFYRMNDLGTDIMTESSTGAIGVMEGVFVVATENDETMTFITEAPGKEGKSLSLSLSQGRGASTGSATIDRAIINFGEGRQLPKFQINRNSSKVFITQDGRDYAVVTVYRDAPWHVSTVDVNFKAERNGNYTLNFNSEEVNFAYLHLIDNMTGADVDLLQTPNYNFEARTMDYPSRFKLLFASGDANDDNGFAFFSNGSWIINNEGNATLQVVDVTGRIVKSESINGSANVNFNVAPGVYMLRLINGENVKVQKIVIR